MKYAIENNRGDFWTGAQWGPRSEAQLLTPHYTALPTFIDDPEGEFELMLYVHNWHPFRIGEIKANYYEPMTREDPSEDPIATVIVVREETK